MSDLVERLREVAERADANYPAVIEQAADRIEQLEAALREIIIHCDWPDRVEKYARAALGEERT